MAQLSAQRLGALLESRPVLVIAQPAPEAEALLERFRLLLLDLRELGGQALPLVVGEFFRSGHVVSSLD